MAMNNADGGHSSGDAIHEGSAGSGDSLCVAACLYHAFSDPTRLAILQALIDGEQNVTELRSRVNLAQSTVSKHLACLRECGLVSVRPEGRKSVYSITHAEQVHALFAATEALLTLTGSSVALCTKTQETVNHCVQEEVSR